MQKNLKKGSVFRALLKNDRTEWQLAAAYNPSTQEVTVGRLRIQG